MKKTVTALALFISVSFLNAQTSFVVTRSDNGAVIQPNSVVMVTVSTESHIKTTFDIQNTSSGTKNYLVKRYDQKLNRTALAYFCFASQCYGANVIVSPAALTLTPSQKASQVSGTYQMLDADFDESDTLGISEVLYTFINQNQSSDSMQFMVRYNHSFAALPVFTFSNVTTSSGTLDPTSSMTSTGLNVGRFKAVGLSANSTKNGVLAFSGWPTGAQDGSDVESSMTGSLSATSYYEISISPLPKMYLSLNSVRFDVNRSADGARHFAVRSGIGGSFTTNLPLSSANSNVTAGANNAGFWKNDATTGAQSGPELNFSNPNFTNLSVPVVLRFYSWDAESSAGTFEIDNVTVDGIASTVVLGIGTVSQPIAARVRIFPNPSAGLINVEHGAFDRLTITDLNGRKVFECGGSDGTVPATVDLSGLSAGTYVIQVFGNQGVSTEKFILAD